MIEIEEQLALDWMTNFWEPIGKECFFTADCAGIKEQLYAQMMGLA